MTINGHIEMFFVAESARTKGVGAVLIRNAERQGARTLECIASNQLARRFYERHHWVVTQEYQRPYGGQNCAFVRYERPGFSG